MLNKAERYQILKIFKIYSVVGLFPIQVDLESWELKAPSKVKKILCALSYGFFILHGLYKMISLAHAYLFVPSIQLHQLVIHGIVAICSAMCLSWYYMLYVHGRAQFAAFVNATLLGMSEGGPDEEGQVTSERGSRLKEYSMQDWIAMSLPYMCMLAMLFTVATYIYDPSMRLLLYAALPTALQTWTSFGLLLIEETRYFLVFIAIVVPVWEMQLISFDRVTHQLQVSNWKLKKGSQSVQSGYRILRSLQLYVSILNDVNSYIIFTWKIVSISMCILSGYAAIAHFSEYPIFGVMYCVMVFDVTFIYTIMFDKAFKIPELFGQVAASALLRIPGQRNNALRRQIQSIPRTGIKVGSFHTMERESTLIFMDFVLKNIVNMLVAYG